MKEYRCYGIVQGSKYLGTVNANSKEEAEDKAYELDACDVSLCHQCVPECEDAEIINIIIEES